MAVLVGPAISKSIFSRKDNCRTYQRVLMLDTVRSREKTRENECTVWNGKHGMTEFEFLTIYADGRQAA